MAKIRFAYVNPVSAVATVLVASSAASGLPVGAVANPDRAYVWRSLTQNGVQTIDINLGSVTAVSSVLLANVKLVGTGILELYERGDAATAGVATLVATLPAQDRDTRTAFVFFASQSHRHWQLKFTNPTAASDYAELGYVHLGGYVESARNIRVPARIARPDPSIGTPSVDGQKTFVVRAKHFAGEWDFEEIDESNLSQLRTLFDAIGVATPHFVVLDDALAWTCWLSRFAGPLAWTLNMMSGRYSVSFPWEEAR